MVEVIRNKSDLKIYCDDRALKFMDSLAMGQIGNEREREKAKMTPNVASPSYYSMETAFT